LLLAGAAAPDAAAEAREVPVAAGQPRQQVLQLGELDLRARLARARVQREDVEDEARAVEHPHVVAPRLLEVPHLTRRKLVVEDHEASPLGAGGLTDLLDRSLADVGRRVRAGARLDEAPDHLAARGVDQPLELVEMVLGDGTGNALGRNADHHDPFAFRRRSHGHDCSSAVLALWYCLHGCSRLFSDSASRPSTATTVPRPRRRTRSSFRCATTRRRIGRSPDGLRPRSRTARYGRSRTTWVASSPPSARVPRAASTR